MSDKSKKGGTVSEAARILGEKGGLSRSPAKQRAARNNGKQSSGRPKGSSDKK